MLSNVKKMWWESDLMKHLPWRKSVAGCLTYL